MATPLVVGPEQIVAFTALAKRAELHPVDMPSLMLKIASPEGKLLHMEQMSKQTVEVPFGFMVTYSIEDGHPSGRCRHLSMSSPVDGRVPNPIGVWMVAEHFGFKGGLDACYVYEEDLLRGPSGKRNIAINIVQPMRLV